jgi:hypothetical protein
MIKSTFLHHSQWFLIILAGVLALAGSVSPLHAQGLKIPIPQDQQLFTGHEDHSISLADATRYVSSYWHKMQPGSILCEYFGKDAIQSLINQDSCVGMRIYNALKDDGTPTFVLVGVNGAGQDMTNGLLEEFGWPCPPFCDTIKVLSR